MKKKLHKKVKPRRHFKRKLHKRKISLPIAGIGIKRGIKGPLGRFDDMNPFPPQLYCKLGYSDTLTLSTTNLANTCGATLYMGLNTLYDPYLAAGGHQPYGFDQLCAAAGPYLRYKVNACLVEMEFFSPSAVDAHACIALHNVSDYAAGSTITVLTLNTIREKSNTQIRQVSTSGKRSVKVKQYIPINIMFEWTKEQFRTEMGSSTGAYNGNPGSIAAIEIGACDPRGNAQSSILCDFRITYYGLFYERVQLGAS